MATHDVHLVTCPACGQKQAPTRTHCRSCGHAFVPTQQTRIPSQTIPPAQQQAHQQKAEVLTERTAKRLKLQILLSCVVMFSGCPMLIAGGGTASENLVGFGFLFFFGGLTWYLITRILIWWRHA